MDENKDLSHQEKATGYEVELIISMIERVRVLYKMPLQMTTTLKQVEDTLQEAVIDVFPVE